MDVRTACTCNLGMQRDTCVFSSTRQACQDSSRQLDQRALNHVGQLAPPAERLQRTGTLTGILHAALGDLANGHRWFESKISSKPLLVRPRGTGIQRSQIPIVRTAQVLPTAYYMLVTFKALTSPGFLHACVSVGACWDD